MVEIERRRDPDAVDGILRSLPDWFGIEEAIRSYVDSAGRLESYLAIENGSVLGVALVERHFARSAELALLAVRAGARHTGAGRALVSAVVAALRGDGFALLEVHTVGPSFDNEPYAQTRGFYESVGFVPVHEFDGIDGWDGPTLVLVMPLGQQDETDV